MFDKNNQNIYSKGFFGLFLGSAVVFAYTPFVIAQPAALAPTDTVVASSTEVLADEDEEPASASLSVQNYPTNANKYFKPETVTERIILNHANELGINAFQLQEQLYALADMTVHIESDNKRGATNAYSGAMSYYQFLPDSVVTAVNRLEIIMREQNLGQVPAWARDVRNNPANMYNLSKPQQRLIMLANIIERDSSDHYIIALASGDDEIAKNIYYKYHHTSPDRATITRTERLFPLYFADQVALK